ncbi:putative glycosaminoglycan xylosylkinase [Penaeus vannamei]|uniref:Putative glycosaminoglycan xylosylkinase n=1 Tax=Penaeus vannamei TaxID=6689 RepID=A0A3R7M274_PENVA|nr:putative glycosaminoglycan xylosylkinase [Penaeus vannamei]
MTDVPLTASACHTGADTGVQGMRTLLQVPFVLPSGAPTREPAAWALTSEFISWLGRVVHLWRLDQFRSNLSRTCAELQYAPNAFETMAVTRNVMVCLFVAAFVSVNLFMANLTTGNAAQDRRFPQDEALASTMSSDGAAPTRVLAAEGLGREAQARLDPKGSRGRALGLGGRVGHARVAGSCPRPGLGDVLDALSAAPITAADVGRGGTQLKLFLTLKGGQAAVFKPESFGDAGVDFMDILAPVLQCCRLRRSTHARLVLLSGGGLSRALRELLRLDPLAPVLADAHLRALDRRLAHVLAALSACSEREGGWHNVLF